MHTKLVIAGIFISSLAFAASPVLTSTFERVKAALDISKRCESLIIQSGRANRLIVVTTEGRATDVTRHSIAYNTLVKSLEAQFSSLDYRQAPEGLIETPEAFEISEQGKLYVVPQSHAVSLHSRLMVLAISNNSLAATDQWINSAKEVFAIHPEDILLLHNDLDLKETGVELQYVPSDSPVKGHRGVELLRQQVGSFYRLRVGIGRPVPPQSVLDYLTQLAEPPRQTKVYPLIDYWLQERTGALALDRNRTYRSHFLDYVSEETVSDLERQSIFDGFFKESHPDLREVFFRLIEGVGIATMADVLALTPNEKRWGNIQLTESELDTTRRWLVLLRAHLKEREQLPPFLKGLLFTPVPKKAPEGTRVQMAPRNSF